ncbi:MAG: DUF342 domain-containing protein [Phycisphaerales bacterium JB064]
MRTDALEKLARLTVSPDGLRATLQLQPGLEASDITPEAIEAILISRGVRASKITPESAGAIARQIIDAPTEPAEAVVAEGVAPIAGVDGRFELDETLAERAKTPTNEGGETEFDHYARSAFIIVEKDERVGTVYPHSEAQDGIDVRGKIIKATPGRPCPLTFDDSVDVRNDGSVIALRKGRLEQTPTRLGVEPVLEIEEYVDFSTGNVSFPGDVIIRKGVRDCFTVEVGGALEIIELVEAAIIVANGSVILRRGMAGRGKGQLSAGGDLEARYLDGADIKVANDLRVQRELTNCVTHVGRSIHSASCSVIGGELWIRFGGVVRSIGGEAEAETLVRLGVDPTLDDRAKQLIDLLPQATNRLARAKQELADLQKMTSKLTPTQAETMTSLQFEIISNQARLPAIRNAIERVLMAYASLNGASLNVERSIMPGVTIAIGARAATVRDTIKGPVIIAMDERGALVIKDPNSGSSMPLASKAKLHPAPGCVDLDELQRWRDSAALRDETKAA